MAEVLMPSGNKEVIEDVIVNGVQQKRLRIYPQREKINLENGDVVILVGPNGSGKSWLLQELWTTASPIGQYVPGYRNISLQSSDYAVASTSVTDLLNQHGTDDRTARRVRVPEPELELRSRFQRLVDLENEFNYRFRKNSARDESSISPVDRVNEILEAGGFKPRLIISDDGLRAHVGDGRVATIDQLSDGERAALLLCAIVVCAMPNTVLLVDEPERHLNPAIARRFIASLVVARRDLAFVFATHDLILAQSMKAAAVYVVEGFDPPGMNSEEFVFRLNKLSGGWDTDLGEAASRALLGGRSKVLFTEGELGSLDEALYGALYPTWDIRPAGSCRKVIDSVKGLRAAKFAHHADARGLIDRDYRTSEELSALQGSGIFAIPACEIESLLCRTKVISALALTRNGKSSVEERTESARRLAIQRAMDTREELAARLAAWRIRREVGYDLPTWTDVRAGKVEAITFDAKAVIEESQAQVEKLLTEPVDLDHLVSSLPIRAVGIPGIIAGALGFRGWAAYKDELLHHLRTGGPIGVLLRNELGSVLPPLD